MSNVQHTTSANRPRCLRLAKPKTTYCCETMKLADEKGLIDYSPNHLTTIDTKKEGWVVHFCPFCGTRLKGTKKSVKRITKYFGKKSRGQGTTA